MLNVNKLKDIREDNDMSQKELSKVLEVNRSTYSLWELGINIIPLYNLFCFSSFFSVSIDYILGLTEDKTNYVKNFDLKIVGLNIKRIRTMNNLSQENIGKILGVTQVCINRYEKGVICISTNNLYKFLKYFKVSTKELFLMEKLVNC